MGLHAEAASGAWGIREVFLSENRRERFMTERRHSEALLALRGRVVAWLPHLFR